MKLVMLMWPVLKDIAYIAIAAAAVWALFELASAVSDVAFYLDLAGRELRGIQHAISPAFLEP